MTHRYIVAAVALAMLVPAAAGPSLAQSAERPSQLGAASPPAEQLGITGSSTLAPLIAEMAQRFQAANPGVGITVAAGGSSRGIADVLSGKADIGMASRALKPHEKQILFVITIARDAVAFVVHRDNPVRQITRNQATAIYEGRVRNWKELGGKDAPIHAVVRTPGHSSLEIVSDYCGLKAEEMKGQIIAGDNSEAMKAVVDDALALSFLSLGAAIDAAQRGMPIRVLTIDGVPATVGELRAGRYPLGRTLSLLTKHMPVAAALAFIQYVQSPEQRAIIEEKDFVPY